MAKDFFGTLGETLTKTARELSGRAEEVYETQRLRNKISGEDRSTRRWQISARSSTNATEMAFR